MPDFTQDDTLQAPPQIVQQPLPDNYTGGQASAPPVDPFAQFVQDGSKNLPAWMDPTGLRTQVPIKTRLDQTLRYTDPNLGFTPLDKNLEDEYASAHPFKTFGNNILQGGARFLGAATEAIATIPLALNAAISGDFNKLYDNDITNGIDGWLKSLDTSLPVFQTNYERDHPVLKYLNPLKLTSFSGAIGGAINNLGFMGGAIAGSLIEDAALTAVTGGAGLFPSLAGNAALITKLGRAGRALAAEPEEVLQAAGLAKVGENIATDLPAISRENAVLTGGINTAVRSTGENIVSQDINAADVLASAKTNDIKAAINNNANYYKIRDAAKYNIALLSSGMAIGAFQAVDVYNKGVDQLSQRFFDKNGMAPAGKDLQQIVNDSKEAASMTMAANIAFTYLTSRLNFGSLFKPTTQAFDEAITGYGSKIAVNKVERSPLDATGDFKYEVVTKTPGTVIGKVLLNGQKIAQKAATSSIEGLQFGAMATISDFSTDYNLRKYDAQNRGEVVDYMHSFLKGVDNNFSTKEGAANLMLGMVVGAFGSPLIHKILAGRGQLSPREQMIHNAELLNTGTLKGTIESSLQEATVQTSLATDHKQAVDNQDKFAAKNIKLEMLYNWVTSGIKANSYRARTEELDAIRNLQGKSFESYWGKEYTPANEQEVHRFLDRLQTKAEAIKSNYEKIDRLTKNPYNSKKAPQDFEAYESYKDQLALNLSKSEDFQQRLKDVRDTLTKLSPGLDVQSAVDLTSIEGLRNILRKLTLATNTLGTQIKTAAEAGTDEETIKGMHDKHQALSNLFSELQPLVTDTETTKGGTIINSAFDGHKFVDVLQKLYDLHVGNSFTSNKYIESQKLISDGKTLHIEEQAAVKDHDSLAEALQNLQDIYKLSEANLNTQRYYNFLREGAGATEYMTKLKSEILSRLQKFTGKDGEIKTPAQLHEEIEEDTRFDMGEPTDIEETTSQERETLRTAAKKVVTGEPLTPEEEKLTSLKPARFANEVKIQAVTKAKIDERFGTPTDDKQAPFVMETKRGVKLTDVFGMFSQDKGNAVQFRTNLYKAIFKSGIDGVFKNLTATYETVDAPDSFIPVPNTGLYRSSFKENIKIFHNGDQVGVLRPVDSLWLDNTGTRSVYDIKPTEYEAITGNDPATYKDFMQQLRSYQDAYNSLKKAMLAHPDQPFTYDDISKHFNLTINTGVSSQNRYRIQKVGNVFNVLDPNGAVVKVASTADLAASWIQQNNNKLARFDTLLKDLNYKPEGTALISLTESVQGVRGGKQVAVKTRTPAIANREELTPTQAAKLDAFLEQNEQFLRDNVNRYAVIVPINGEYQKNSILFARNADTTQEDRASYFTQIKNAANGSLTGDKLNDAINDIHAKYFLANNDRTIKQTFITTSFYEDGDFLLNINNPSLKVYKQITIAKEDIQNVKTYGDFINKLQGVINATAAKDDGLRKLQVDLTEDSLKRQIPNDDKITKLSQVEDVIKVATIPDVFRNYNINFNPKLAGEQQTSAPKPPVPTGETDRKEASLLAFLQGLNNIKGLSGWPGAQAYVDEHVGKDASLKDIKEYVSQRTKNIQGKPSIQPDVDRITKDYGAKRANLNKDFNASLNDKERSIKEAIAKDVSLATNIDALLKLTNTTPHDLESYSKKATAYNEQFNVLKGIQEQRINNLVNVSKPIFAKTKAGIHTIMEDLFGLPAEQAAAVADIYDANAKAWAARTGKTVSDYYKQLGFKSQLEDKVDLANILNSEARKSLNEKVANISYPEVLSKLNKFLATNGEKDHPFIRNLRDVINQVINGKHKRVTLDELQSQGLEIPVYLLNQPKYRQFALDLYKLTPEEGRVLSTLADLYRPTELAFSYDLLGGETGATYNIQPNVIKEYINARMSGGRQLVDNVIDPDTGEKTIYNRTDAFGQKFFEDYPDARKLIARQVFLTNASREAMLNQIVGEKGISLYDNSLITINLGYAKLLEQDGVPANSIFWQTGWEKGKDGKWKYDLQDKFELNDKTLTDIHYWGSGFTLGDLIDNKKLFKAYPQLKDVKVEKVAYPGSSYNYKTNTINISKNKLQSTKEKYIDPHTNKVRYNSFLSEDTKNAVKLTLVHEIQHAVQRIEDFAKGSNPDNFKKENQANLDKLADLATSQIIAEHNNDKETVNKLQQQIDELQKVVEESNPYTKYRRVAGEVEARNAQTRYLFDAYTAARNSIESTEDIDRDSQIILDKERGLIEQEINAYKSPNGKITELSEHVYSLVRSTAFKNWAGDWEKAANEFAAGKYSSIKEALVANKSEVLLNNKTLEPQIFWHQTDQEGETGIRNSGKFNNDVSASAKYDYNTPEGFYFKSSDKEIPLNTTGAQMPFFLKGRNTIEFAHRTELLKYLKDNVEGYKENIAKYRSIVNNYVEDPDPDELDNLVKEMRLSITKHFADKNIDIVKLTKDRAGRAVTDTYVAFNNKNIKLATGENTSFNNVDNILHQTSNGSENVPFNDLKIPEFSKDDTEIDETDVYPELTDNINEKNYPYLQRIIKNFSSDIIEAIRSILGNKPGSTASERFLESYGVNLDKAQLADEFKREQFTHHPAINETTTDPEAVSLFKFLVEANYHGNKNYDDDWEKIFKNVKTVGDVLPIMEKYLGKDTTEMFKKSHFREESTEVNNTKYDVKLGVANQIDDDSPNTMVYDLHTGGIKYLNELWKSLDSGSLDFPKLSQQWLENFYRTNNGRYLLVDVFDGDPTIIASEELFNKKYNDNAENPFPQKNDDNNILYQSANNQNKAVEDFYSPIEKLVQNSKQSSFTKEQIFGQIKNLPQAEIEAIGLRNFLKDKDNVTKQQLLDYIRDNKVHIEIKTLSGPQANPYYEDFADDIPDEVGDALKAANYMGYGNANSALVELITNTNWDDMGSQQRADKWGITHAQLEIIEEYVDKFIGDATNLAKYGDYVLPGKHSNYREVLITLPQENLGDKLVEVAKKYGLDDIANSKFGRQYRTLDNNEQREVEFELRTNNIRKYTDYINAREDARMESGNNFYQSSHFDEANIVAHIRLTDRMTPDGKKILLVEEQQSDWALEGRKEGYRFNSPHQAEYDRLLKEEYKAEGVVDKIMREIRKQSGKGDTSIAKEILSNNEEVRKAYLEYITINNKRLALLPDIRKSREGVANMPFKNDKWVELTTKKAIQIAAQEGYDGIAWVNGEQTADRYRLDKYLNNVDYSRNEDGTYHITAIDKEGAPVLDESRMTPEQIEKHLGKDIVSKIVNGIGESQEYNSIRGNDENGSPIETKRLQGDNLKIKAGWARNLYDKQIPKLAGKYAKQYGGKTTNFEIDKTEVDKHDQDNKYLIGDRVRLHEFNDEDVHEPEQEGKILEIKGDIATIEIDQQYRNGPADDGLRELDVDQIKELIPPTTDKSSQFGIDITQQMREATKSLPLFQEHKAAYNKLNNTIYALTNPDVTSPLHELAHSWEPKLTQEERQKVLDWAKQTAWTRDTSERFANGFEKYLSEGVAPKPELQPIFDKFAKWLKDVIQKIRALFGNDFDLNDDMRSIYAKLLDGEFLPKEEESPTQNIEAAKPIEQKPPVEEAPKPPVTEEKSPIEQPTEPQPIVEQQPEKRGIRIDSPEYVDMLNGQIKYEQERITAAEKELEQSRKYLQEVKDLLALEKAKIKVSPSRSTEDHDMYEQDVKRIKAYIKEKQKELNASKERKELYEGFARNSKENLDKKNNLQKALDAPIPKDIDANYSRNGLDEAIKDGRFREAVRTGQVSVEKAKAILDYFNVSAGSYKSTFAEAEQKQTEALKQQPANEQPLNDQELSFINLLKANQDGLKGAFAAGIKDSLNNEDYRGVISTMHELFTDDAKTAKAILNNDELYKAFKKLTGVEDEHSTAKDLLDKYEQAQPSEQEQTKYVAYKEPGPDDTIVERYGKVVQDNGFTTTIEDARGNQTDRVTSALKPATSEQYESQKTHVPAAKYIVGDKVLYGADKKPYTIIDSEQRVREDSLNKPISKHEYDTFYNTEEGLLINEAGIVGLARDLPAAKEFKLRAEHQERFRALKNISGRFEKLFPQIKTQIGYFDFNAPARFNKGQVEINIGYGDVRFTQAEINAANLSDPFNVPWLKREAVAHEFMHPFIIALQESNTPLYKSLVKEIANHKDILKHVDAAIKAGTYKEFERDNEALAIYLGKEITKAFNKNGSLNADYVAERKKSLVQRFLQWLNDVFDYLTGVKKMPTLSEFVKNANTDAAAQKELLRKQIKAIDPLNDIYVKQHNRQVEKTVAFIKRTLGDAMNADGTLNEEHFEEGRQRLADKLGIGGANANNDLNAKIHERPDMENPVYKVVINGKYRFFQRSEGMNPSDTAWYEVVKRADGIWASPKGHVGVIVDGFLGYTKNESIDKLSSEIEEGGKMAVDSRKLDNIIDTVSDYIQQKPTGRFEFIERVNENDGVEFDQSDQDHIKVYVDPIFADQVSGPSVMQQYGARLTDNKAAEEFQALVQRNFYKAGNKKPLDQEIGVRSLNPLMRLQDVSDYVVKNLADQNMQFKYDTNELKSIDELTAYMAITDDEAKRTRDKITARLKLLQDTATTRLDSPTLRTQYNVLHRLNLDETDKDFVLKYTQQAAIGINIAWRKFNELREDLKNPELTKPKLNRLNKDLDVIKQLVGFYDDFNNIYNRFDDSFNVEDLQKFNKVTSNLNRLRDSMNETAINLAVKWFMPYVEKHNEFIKKEGYTSPRYQLTEKDLYDNFRYGTTKDTNFITFNLGATVTSRDPVNAIFSNIVADMLSVNNVNIVSDSFDINEGYSRFIKQQGFSNSDSKAQVKYYKQHYLRDIEVLADYYDEVSNTYKERYIKKAALHQEYYFDKYEQDLRTERAKYANPRNAEEATQFQEALTKWKTDRNYGKAEQYRNHAYTALQNDSYFKLLEKHYNAANEKYGALKLQFGIIPQKYDANIVEQLQAWYKDVKAGKTTSDKFTIVKDKTRLALAGLKKDQSSINLDDTIYRRVNSNLNQLKEDANIDFNLHNSIIDFVAEATNYGSLKEVQYNAENLRMLIEGNVKFSIPGRKIGKEDFEAKIRQPIQLRKAKEKLAELQALKDAGQEYDQDLYKKLTDKVAKGIQPSSLWDKFAGTVKPSDTNRLNEQLRQFINDSFYGESVEEAKVGSISLNKAAHYLGMYTSINNMAFNTIAGVSNVVIGDVQMLIEGHGGKYYNKAELAKATADYIKNIPNYMADLKNPIKSKDTQISFILDAIQGEVLDEFGNRISGNIAKRMFNVGSLFMFTSLGEHQIQITGMKAMLLGRKVETTDGHKITLYDAFVKDANGRYALRKDLKDFDNDDLQHFIRQLHSVNRALNGNYSALHKGTLQRKWYGTLALKFRKYIYEAFRTRYASEHTDYEKNTVEVGYLKFFLKDYLYKNVRKLLLRQAVDFKGKDLLPHEKYALRKAVMEVGIYISISTIVAGLFGGKSKKDLTPAEKALLLYSLRLRNDLGMYHASIFSEFKQQTQNPTASMTTAMALGKTLQQLMHPSDTYTITSNGHTKGDNKLIYDLKKLIPIASKFPIDLDNRLSYFNLVNQNVQGVHGNQNAN